MSKKRKACSGAVSPKQAKSDRQGASPLTYDITNQRNFPVYNLIPTGKNMAVSPQYLVNILGLKSTRELRKEIEWERKHGAIILADLNDGGYFKPGTIGEISDFVSTMKHSIQTTQESIRPMINAIAAGGEI